MNPEEFLRFARALVDLAWEQHARDLPFGPFSPDEIRWDGSQIALDPTAERGEGQSAEEARRNLDEGVGCKQREDILWLGRLLFWVGTGEFPTEGSPLPSQLRGELPTCWDGILSNCLHQNPLERFAHAGDLLRAIPEVSGSLPEPKERKGLILPLALLALLAAYLFGFEIHGHGRTYDDLVQRGRGESMLQYFSTGDPAALPSKNLEDFSRGDRLYGPFASTLAVWIGKHLAPWVGDPRTELHLPFHTGLTLFGLLFVLCCYVLAKRVCKTPLSALASTLLLLALPRVFGQLTSNPSDLPAAALMALSAVMMFRWFDRPNLGRTLSFAIALAALGATRMQNGGLMALLCLPVILVRFLQGRKGSPLPLKQVLLLPALAWVFFVLFWPDFWFSPLSGPLEVLSDFFRHQSRYTQGTLLFGKLQSKAPSYPLVLLAISTPFSILALFLLGLFHKRPTLPQFFLGLWLLLSIGKHLSGIANHGGIRHFLDAFIPLAIFAGLGLQRALDLLGVFSWRRATTLGLPLLFLGLGLLTHPYESSYYNLLVGGTPGAAGRFDLDSNGSSFLVLMKRLRPRLKEGDFLFIPGSKDLVVQVPLPKNCPVFPLRPDQEKLVQSAIQAGVFKNRRCILLFHQGILWGRLDELIRQKRLKILLQTGPKGLPLSMALLVPKPVDLIQVMKDLK